MRMVLNVVAVVLILLGAVWFLQGLNVLGGGLMSGHIQWSVYGGIMALIGVGLLVYANRRGYSSSKK